MKNLRKLLSVLLAGAMVLAVMPFAVSAEKETSNLSIAVDKDTVEIGDTVTVTLENAAMSVFSFTGGLHFDTAKFTCTTITGSQGNETIYLTKDGEPEAAMIQSSVADATRNGNIGFAFVGTEESTYEADTIVTATFTAKVKGNAVFTVYESSDGTDGFSPNISADADSVTVTVTTPPRPVGYENIAPYADTEDCGSETYDAAHTVNTINDGDYSANGYQPKTWTSGDWVALIFDQTYDVDQMVLYWETQDYIDTYDNHGFEVYFLVGDEWQVATGLTAEREILASGEAKAVDTLSMTANGVDGVKIEFLDGNITDHKYAPKLYEMEVYGIQSGVSADVTLGDVDKNGEVAAADLTALARHVGAIEVLTDEAALKAADVDVSGDITAADLTKLARFVGGIDSSL